MWIETRRKRTGTRPPRSNFRKLDASPSFRNGYSLRPYQLEGLNWLIFSWYNRRSVMLAVQPAAG